MLPPRKVEGTIKIADDYDEVCVSIDELVSRLVRARYSVPEADLPTTFVRVSASGGEDLRCYIEVVYYRDLTAEEIVQREVDAKKVALQLEVSERQELARLMNKYGWPPPEKLG